MSSLTTLAIIASATLDELIEEIKSRGLEVCTPEFMAKVKAIVEASQWQPIETAPKDGTEIIGGRFFSCGVPPLFNVTQWRELRDGGYWSGTGIEYTHWMPMPASPEVSK